MTTGTHVLPDPGTPFGRTVRARLREEPIIWLTTVAASGTPQPNPVWFLWQPDEGSDRGEGSFLIYHDNTAARLRTLTERPRVSLNFNSDPAAESGSITVFTGSVEILEGHPPAHEVPAYAAKYGPRVQAWDSGRDLAAFMAKYSIVTRIRPDKVRGF
jgi:PPOX class probable F420-dependent enzyme